MANKKSQIRYERLWAQALLNFLNENEGSDYAIAEYDNSKNPAWADVDVKAASASNEWSPLYLQLTRDDRLDTVFEHNGHKTPVFKSDNILQAISDKQQKYLKSGKDFSQITLVIQGTLTQSSVPFEITEQLLDECKKYPFKSIYYLSAPALVGPLGQAHTEEGWLVRKLK